MKTTIKKRRHGRSAPDSSCRSLTLAGVLLAAPALGDIRVLEEVIVTAQKTAQSLQDVPISVSAVTGDTLRQANISTLAELAVQLPNVNFASEGQQNNQVYIRGFGTNPFNPSFESSVGLVRDEVFYGRSAYFSEVPFDIERIEVLRGPQGTLFGKNTVAGVFNLTSRGVTEEPQLYLEMGSSEHGGRKAELATGAMLGDSAGVRLAAVHNSTDGELYNTALDRNEENPDYNAQRVKFLWLPHDAVEVELLAQRSDTEMNHWPQQLWQLDDDSRNYLEQFDAQVEDDPYNGTSSMNTPGFLQRDTSTIALKTEVDFGAALGLEQLDMTVVAARSELTLDVVADLDASPADIATMFAFDEHLQHTLEWRFSGSNDGLFGLGSSLDFVGGLFYYSADYGFDGGFKQGEDTTDYVLTEDAAELAGDFAVAIPALYALTLTQDNQRFDLDFTRDTRSLGLFGQFTWFVTDTFLVTPGLRVNRETKRADVRGTLGCDRAIPESPCTFGLVLGAQTYALTDQERSVTDISPKLSLMYAPSDELNVYLTASQGFKSGGYNALSFTGEQLTFDDELARSVEIGSKGRFFDRSLSVNLALFHTEFDDLQVLAYNGVFFDVRNAATATSRGLEVDWQWLTPWQPLSINGALGILDSTYDSYPGAPAPYAAGRDSEQDLAGGEVAYSPEHSLTVSPMLQIPLGNRHGLQAVLDVVHTGDKYTDTDLDPNSLVKANTKLNLRVSIGHISQLWSFTVGIKNLTDEKTLNIVTDAPFFPGSYYAHQSPGRAVYSAVRLDW
ncbi:outer membrane receptor protein involved in Fe transport [Litorivivens lipolytica]|uniref:Outer membrane receptor protein involved in Fe transport n=1 Tax=Litorivivens lipolytica TaxID=1524264 RepID=A0A7W4W4K8_9GAMM|nr:TonB-dependent receptor [Litorivivens lipolytica]MBB3047220.1 outer membrane receptor protein involved in Fe transport [Litorivivens lipolytica]